jgi:hypothetical protein
MNGNEGHWGEGISTVSQNFPKYSSIPLESSISQTNPKRKKMMKYVLSKQQSRKTNNGETREWFL